MDIKSSNINDNKEYLEKLNKRQKSEIISREGEIENVKKLYDQKIAEEKIHGQLKIHETLDRNQKQIIEATEGKQERLDRMKQNLADTKKRLSKESEVLKAANNEKLENNKIVYTDKFQEQYDKAAEESKAINFKTNQTLKEMDSNTKAQLREKSYETKLLVNQADAQSKMAIENASEGNSRDVERIKREHAYNLRRTEKENQKNIKEINDKNLIESGERTRIHKDQTVTAEAHHQEKIKATEKAFQDKYRNLTKNHSVVIQRLKDRFAQEIKSLVVGHTKEKSLKQTKKADDFYHTEKLNPTIKEGLDHYIISVPVAEHEKENFILSADKRTIKLSFARKFDERVENEKDEVFNTRRSETLKKEFLVKDILDSRKIEEMYSDGILSYKIKKA
tara:strand:- start:355295 stop:356473 length:1179 start_codon:yes stop_codon:yes gene_type:complete